MIYPSVFRIIFMLLIAAIFSTQLEAKFIFLKNGLVIEGDVLDKGKTTTVVRDKENKLREIPNDDISMILSSAKLPSDSPPVENETPDKANRFLVELSPALLQPYGVLSDIAHCGYGAQLNVFREDALKKDSCIGISAAFFYLNGKDRINTDSIAVKRILMIPLFISVNYPLLSLGRFSLVPELSLGTVLTQSSCTDYRSGGNGEYGKQTHRADPSAKAGISARLTIAETYFVSLGSNYLALYDSGTVLSSVQIYAGCGLRL